MGQARQFPAIDDGSHTERTHAAQSTVGRERMDQTREQSSAVHRERVPAKLMEIPELCCVIESDPDCRVDRSASDRSLTSSEISERNRAAESRARELCSIAFDPRLAEGDHWAQKQRKI